jgi:Domain of Unknown Function (DUF1080)
MKSPSAPLVASLLTVISALAAAVTLPAAPEALNWLGHDRTRPAPRVVDPGVASTADKPGKAPSDAVVLFDGTNLSSWAAVDGQPTKWINHDGVMECVPGSGYIRSLQCFGACQLHVEFATPSPAHGTSQGRGNSGVFFGLTRYEVQVLDSYENKTYADGSCGSVYNEYPPLVNVSRPPGEWQTYDMVWTPPRFAADGALVSPPYLTVFHNGVLIQNHVELSGENGWLDRSTFKAHPEKLPIALQDHGNPVRYRNIWVRELTATKPEFYLPDAVLDGFCGSYENCEVARRDGNLLLTFQNHVFMMFAESPTHFFAKNVDIQAEFDPADHTIRVTVGEDVGEKKHKK